MIMSNSICILYMQNLEMAMPISITVITAPNFPQIICSTVDCFYLNTKQELYIIIMMYHILT